MKKILFALVFFTVNQLNSQIKENTYELNALDNLLTDDVKKIVDNNISGKQVVFLGEAVHYSGSDFLAKAEFVKYLVMCTDIKTSRSKVIFSACCSITINVTSTVCGALPTNAAA